MKKYLIALFAAALLASSLGCANGPLRQWCRGAPCNTCNPKIQQPLNVAPPCNSGCAENTGNSGIISRWFRGNGQQQANCGTGACGTGVCSNGTCNSLPPAAGNQIVNEAQGPNLPMMIDSAPGGLAPGEVYGNASNSVGRLEMPPINFGDN